MYARGSYFKYIARGLKPAARLLLFLRGLCSRKYHLQTPCPECGAALFFDTGYPATREEPGDDGDGLVCVCGWMPLEHEVNERVLSAQLDVYYQEQAEALAQAEQQAEEMFNEWMEEQEQKEQSEWNW